ncbi:MAG: flagellar basal body-associated FliL family protein [Planctomycetota bacterium]
MAGKKDKEAQPKGSAIFALIKAVAFVSVLVVVQVVAAALLIPSPQDTEELARSLASAKAGEEAEGQDDGTTITEAQTKTEEPTVEVELGPFTVTRFNPESDTTINVDFELYATVLADEKLDFDTQFETNRNRVRDQVTVTLHSAEASQLTDPGLGLIKRRILEKTNRALGKPLVREILVTRFNFVER